MTDLDCPAHYDNASGSSAELSVLALLLIYFVLLCLVMTGAWVMLF